MFDKMKQLMELKKQADQIKRDLEATQIEIQEVKGIKILINGSQNIQSLDIDESLLNPANKKNFERDLSRSLNAAVRKSQEAAASKMKALMPGFPGM